MKLGIVLIVAAFHAIENKKRTLPDRNVHKQWIAIKCEALTFAEK